ncbi:MAG: thioredoxin [Candidatus Nanopelagicaceae bacterium]|nr:thioredoxin [Candidatus Nanopelagicaceae bacterium]
MVQEVTTATFDAEVLKSSTPVLVDFWAQWCGPCRAVAPILEEISKEYVGKLRVVKVNTDEESRIAIKYGITSLPTLAVFVNGDIVKSIIGAKPKPALLKDLAAFL